MQQLPVLDFAEKMAALPPQPPIKNLDAKIQKHLWSRYDVVIVLDDDPTGTQTVYDIPVVTELTEEAITQEIQNGTPLFYLLTNSRAVKAEEITFLTGKIGVMIRDAAEKTGKKPLIILRGDSTLRGHYPAEDTIVMVMSKNTLAVQYLIPAFFEGGRYTIDDIHYVQEGDKLVPAAQTAFAQDASFGYNSSNLKRWIAEKEEDPEDYHEIGSISIAELRDRNRPRLINKVSKFQMCQRVVVNAANYHDLKVAIAAILAPRNKQQIHFRTSASFIKALLGQPEQPLLTFPANPNQGGLIVVGSHVPKTTAQLAHLRTHVNLSEYEVNVRALLFEKPDLASCDLAQKIGEDIAAGKNVLLYTSREVITTDGADANLDIAAKVSGYLEEIVATLTVAPAFLVTKGGITSSRIATESLGVKRAMALGQVQAGVPTWELGPESRFPGLPFIIFPGNVGGEDALTSLLQNTII